MGIKTLSFDLSGAIRGLKIGAVLLSLVAACAGGESNAAAPTNTPPSAANPESIIQSFAAKEAAFKIARDHYTYDQEVTVQTLEGGTVDGEYKQTVEITFDDKGHRVERVLYAPAPTLTRIEMTREDMDDIQNQLPFVLTTEELPEYNITYLGPKHVDELDTYVFEVEPKKIEKGKRYFKGKIYVDNQDMQIVLTDGKTLPEIRRHGQENLFPSFVTYREQVDGKYWFPTYTKADDYLHFSSGDVHIREIVKYTNYKRFGSDVKILFNGEEVKAAPNATKK